MRHPLGLLTLLVIATCVSTINNEQQSSNIEAVRSHMGASHNGFGKGKIFFKSYSTKTKTLLSFFTSTVPFTCYSVSSTVMACVRRKRGLKLPTDLQPLDGNDNVNLESSVESAMMDEKSSASQKKFLVTLWSTSSSTLTVTTFITNQRVTLSASVACTVPGVILPLC